MKTNRRSRRLMRARNKNRVNRLKNQHMAILLTPLFILVLISLKLGVQSTPEKVLARLRMHIEKLTGNLNFPITDPLLSEMETMEEELTDLIDAVNAGYKGLLPERNQKVSDAKEMIRLLSYNIQFLSEGDEVKIKSAGFDVRKPKGPSQPPGQVLNLVTKPVGPGKIKLTWKKDEHSTVYVVSMKGSLPLPEHWDNVGTTRNVTFEVENLTPGQLYYFRVFGTNGNINGNPSDPAEQRSL